MKRWHWALLLFGLFLFALILVLPQVDLPDTAFRDGNSPIMAKLQVTAAPVMSASLTRIKTWSPTTLYGAVQRDIPSSETMTSAERRSLLCTMLC